MSLENNGTPRSSCSQTLVNFSILERFGAGFWRQTAAVSIHIASKEERAGGRGRKNCTFRRFKIRGLIEGMLRTVMGNICQGGGAVIKHRWPPVKKGHRAKVTRRPEKGNRVGPGRKGWGDVEGEKK